MNFGCQADVFQLPHHRQYLIGASRFGCTVTFNLIARINFVMLNDNVKTNFENTINRAFRNFKL